MIYQWTLEAVSMILEGLGRTANTPSVRALSSGLGPSSICSLLAEALALRMFVINADGAGDERVLVSSVVRGSC